MTENLGGKYVIKKKDPLKPFYPLIGVGLIAVSGVIGIFTSGPAYSLLQEYAPQVRATGCPDMSKITSTCQMQGVVGVAIGLIVVVLCSAVFAAFAPKERKEVSEKVLIKERNEIDQERRRAKKRKLEMRAKMKKATRELDDL